MENNRDELVSIIIPVYKVEKYIERCIRSLMRQDYRNIEIIIVDDGSPDSSGSIIDRLSNDDIRVRAFHKQNGGVSSARNFGVEKSTGDWIMFVDGDDWVDCNYVSYFLDMVKASGCQLAMNVACHNDTSLTNKSYSTVVSKDEAIEMIYREEIFVAVWNKIYNSSFLKKYGIYFNTEIWYGEGMLFNIECLQYVDRIALGQYPVYHQMYNPDSAMRSFNLDSNLCGIRSMDIQKDIIKNCSRNVLDAWRFHRYRFNVNIINGIVLTDTVKANRKIYSQCINELRKGIILPLKYEEKLVNKIGWIKYFLFPTYMAKRQAKRTRIKQKNRGGGYYGNVVINLHFLLQGRCEA